MAALPKTSDKEKEKQMEEGRYAKKAGGTGRLLLSLTVLVLALGFCLLAVLRADFARPNSLIWAAILLGLALASAYAGLVGIMTWWENRKQ